MVSSMRLPYPEAIPVRLFDGAAAGERLVLTGRGRFRVDLPRAVRAPERARHRAAGAGGHETVAVAIKCDWFRPGSADVATACRPFGNWCACLVYFGSPVQ